MGKYCSNPQFGEESYRAFTSWFSVIVIVNPNQLNILKNKISKDNFEKNHNKKHKIKTIWENTIAIHSVLKKNITKLNSQSAQYKKNKIDKDNFEKNKTKRTYIGKHCSNP
jgi:hypothetical protein